MDVVCCSACLHCTQVGLLDSTERQNHNPLLQPFSLLTDCVSASQSLSCGGKKTIWLVLQEIELYSKMRRETVKHTHRCSMSIICIIFIQEVTIYSCAVVQEVTLHSYLWLSGQFYFLDFGSTHNIVSKWSSCPRLDLWHCTQMCRMALGKQIAWYSNNAHVSASTTASRVNKGSFDHYYGACKVADSVDEWF